MVRGTNRMIIEVVETDNQFFEKAILFVKEGHADKTERYLDGEAKKYVSRLKGNGKVKKPGKARYIMLAKLSAAAMSGALLALLIIQNI